MIKSQLTIILTLGRKHKEKENSQSKKGRRNKIERKFPMKEWEKAPKKKEKEKFPIKE